MTKITATDCVRDGLSPAIQYTPGENELWAPAGKDERTVILVRNDSGTDCGVLVEAGYPGSQRSGHRTGAPGERIYLSADLRRPGDPAASDLSRQTTGEKEKICGDRPLHEAENDRR